MPFAHRHGTPTPRLDSPYAPLVRDSLAAAGLCNHPPAISSPRSALARVRATGTCQAACRSLSGTRRRHTVHPPGPIPGPRNTPTRPPRTHPSKQAPALSKSFYRVRYTCSSTVRCVRVYMCATLRCVMCVYDEYDVYTSQCIRHARNVRLYDVSSVRCKRRVLTMATVLPTHEKLHSTLITACDTMLEHAMVGSHTLNQHKLKLRVPNPRIIAYFNFKMHFESSNLPGAGPISLD